MSKRGDSESTKTPMSAVTSPTIIEKNRKLEDELKQMTKAMATLMMLHEEMRAERKEQNARVNRLEEYVERLLHMTSQLKDNLETSPMTLDLELSQQSDQSTNTQPPHDPQNDIQNISMTNNNE